MSFGGGNDVSYAGPSVARTGGMFDQATARKGPLDRAGDLMGAAFGYKATNKGATTSLISQPDQTFAPLQDTPGRHKSLLGQ
jgi:hypothetical protein